MAIDDKERIHFRGRGPRGERKARKLNALVDMIHRAAPAKAGHVNVLVRQTDSGSVFSAKARGDSIGGDAPSEFNPQLHVGELTTVDPYPTPAEMTEAIESAIDENEPKIGDIVILTRDSGNVVAAKFTLIGAAPDGQPSNIGLWLRAVTEGEGEDETTFRAVGGQTGAYA